MWYPPASISDRSDWIEVTAWKVYKSECNWKENNSSYLDCLDWNVSIQEYPIVACSAHFSFTRDTRGHAEWLCRKFSCELLTLKGIIQRNISEEKHCEEQPKKKLLIVKLHSTRSTTGESWFYLLEGKESVDLETRMYLISTLCKVILLLK